MSERPWPPAVWRWAIVIHRALLWAALLWALFNCLYVYLALGAERTYRIETSALILVGLLAPLAFFPSRQPDPIAPVDNHARMLMLFSMAVWLFLFLPLLSFPFLSDDYVFLALYQDATNLAAAPQFFRPLFAVIFWLISGWTSAAPQAFHAVSFALHLWSACCVYQLARRLLASTTVAAIGFAVFLLNPLQLEAVLWASGLQEALWVSGILSALVVYTAHKQLTLGRLVATLTLVSLSLLSKETAVCYVLLLPAADFALYRWERGRLLVTAYALFAAQLIGYLGMRSRFVQMESGYFLEPSTYFVKQLVTTPYRFFIQPWNADAVDMPVILACGLAVASIGLLFWTVAVRRASRGPLAGAFAILASTLPVYSYFFVREDLLSARYIYFASAGWALILAACLGSTFRSSHSLVAVGLSLTLWLTIVLRINLTPWTVAAEVVRVAETSVAESRDPRESVREWSARNGIELEFRDAVPYEYRGVGIFINGYPEFVQHVTSQLGGRSRGVQNIRD